MNYFTNAFSVAFGQQGRARRGEFWTFTFVSTLIIYVLSRGIYGMLVFSDDPLEVKLRLLSGPIFGLLILSYVGFNVQVRRLHDTGRSAWHLLWHLLPGIGHIVLLVFFCKAGTVGPNKYGPDPKGSGEMLKDIAHEA
ncbi:MAG: DUF805 domain-containing protein [Bacteroidia bacterium]|nr:MAG: DUF805 domain-containing protein [Bacteroidia bacterium]